MELTTIEQKKVDIDIYTVNHYYKNYNKTNPYLKYNVYALILNTFMQECVNYLLSGLLLVLPIGRFQIKKTYLNPDKVYYSYAKLNKTGNKEDAIRVQTFYWRPYFLLSEQLRSKRFTFKSLRTITREIPKYFSNGT